VDDVVQEIFIAAYKGLPAFEGRSSLKTWLFGIVVNTVRNYRRNLRSLPRVSDVALDGGELASVVDVNRAADETASATEAVRIVDGLLDGLGDDKREVFVLSELEQMSVPEIAQTLGIPLNTAYSRLRLARRDFAGAVARYRARLARVEGQR
jgi:RNA polymerase sigma-70 factor (ECF subfamily)